MNATSSPEVKKRNVRTKWSWLTLGFCLLSFLAGRYWARAGSSLEPDKKQVEVVEKVTGEDFEVVAPYGPIVTRSEGDYTPELLRRASHVLNGYTLSVRQLSRESHPNKLFRVSVMGGMEGIFWEKDGAYVHVDSKSELIAINEILLEHKFRRQDFDDPRRVDSLLDEIIWLHSGSSGLIPCSSLAFERMRPLDDWLRGTEKDQAVLRALCQDPEFSFDGDVWVVVFNVIGPDGAVDRYRVVGRHNSLVSVNEIWGIRSISVKPPGTFSYPIL